jgi:L-iditol 2-dehydrogenase
METMKALVKYGTGRGNMRLEQKPLPKTGPSEVLVHIAFCGVCGTDLKIEDGHFPCTPPVILGHEFSGIVAGLGSEVDRWKVGDRVVSEQHVACCGMCDYCLTGRRQFCRHKRSPGYYSDGAFTDFIAVEASLLHKVPDGVSLLQAALVEPMAIAATAILGKAGVHPGDFVAILGSGPIALLALQMLKAVGAGRVVTTGLDADEANRFPAARRFHADCTINAERTDPVKAVMEISSGEGADLVVDLSGAPVAIRTGLSMLKKDGRFCALGMPAEEVALPWSDLVLRAASILFSYSSDYKAWERCLNMLAEGKILTDGFTEHVYNLNSWEDAFKAARSGEILKAIIRPEAGAVV